MRMGGMHRCWWAASAVLLSCLSAAAQPPNAAAPAVAARVNGQPIPESAVQRPLERVPEEKREAARKEVLDFLIGNVLIDQFVQQLPQCAVDAKEMDAKEDEVRAELKKLNKDFAKWLEEKKLTEADLRQELAADLRWTKYCTGEATDEKLRQLFDSNKEVFDGTMVRARHILLTPSMSDAKAVETAAGQVRGIRKEVEDRVEAGMKECKETDALAREKKRRDLLDDAFAEAAKKYSQCPSKEQGGDVDYFQRSGKMVEPFSKAAFALKPFQMSDPVQTQFGVHLILVTDRKQGLDVKFEEIKEDVKEEFCDRLREQLIAKLRPQAKIEITSAPKAEPLPGPK
jgi:parvulin-like peptidyl-prolyl isomerase